MKRSPSDIRLEKLLRSSKFVAGGFMGDDPRTPEEVIREDAACLERLGKTAAQIAERMRRLTEAASAALGNPVQLEGKFDVRCEEWKGGLICPWPHPGRFPKRLTVCRRFDTGREIVWSDLNIHLIEAHGFFEGKGASYRLEPEDLVRVLFE
ncbi:MAG TPA: hypothetical protein PKY88_04200 [Anaerohalosphaeraceae bacterium]|nr:hypothetical protein [Anaerohalosphaeraceae bacterium]